MLKKPIIDSIRQLIFEKSKAGRRAIFLPEIGVSPKKLEDLIPPELLRKEIDGFPELTEQEIIRHYTDLSQLNFSVDTGFYPLGSCTMKYNPRINEEMSKLPGFVNAHPLQDISLSQGCLQLMYELAKELAEICGMYAVTLQPAAGAQGELTGMLIAKAYFQDRNEKRDRVLIPDSAHGTNPASCAIAGFSVTQINSNKEGTIDLEMLERELDETVAGIMLTIPNTLGLFEKDILKIVEMVHKNGSLVYMDGANLNALLGKAKPGDMGVDIMHFNLHKTFSTPHGGGGPGSGPVGVVEKLAPYLPVPVISKTEEGSYYLDYNREKSIGRVSSFYGNFAVMVRAYCYLKIMGKEGLEAVSRLAVLNANYLKKSLQQDYHLPYKQTCMHEFVLSDKYQQKEGVKTLDIAKRLADYGFHPPTVYFPLIVPGAMMIEPTETESKETLDAFVGAMKEIAKECKENKEVVLSAPHNLAVKRLDEVIAARNLNLRYQKQQK